MTRILVCGGRACRSPEPVWSALDASMPNGPIAELMQGGASGVDTFARQWAVARAIKRWVCRADWSEHGRAAGPVRNSRMLEWKPDLVVAFSGGRGTDDCIKKARALGIEIIEVGIEKAVVKN